MIEPGAETPRGGGGRRRRHPLAEFMAISGERRARSPAANRRRHARVDARGSSRPGDEKRSISTEMEIVVSAEELIAGSLARQGLAANADTVALLRRAMSIPVSDRMKPLPGALELLQEIHALGMKTVIASNTYWRDADSYWADF